MIDAAKQFEAAADRILAKYPSLKPFIGYRILPREPGDYNVVFALGFRLQIRDYIEGEAISMPEIVENTLTRDAMKIQQEVIKLALTALHEGAGERLTQVDQSTHPKILVTDKLPPDVILMHPSMYASIISLGPSQKYFLQGLFSIILERLQRDLKRREDSCH